MVTLKSHQGYIEITFKLLHGYKLVHFRHADVLVIGKITVYSSGVI